MKCGVKEFVIYFIYVNRINRMLLPFQFSKDFLNHIDEYIDEN